VAKKGRKTKKTDRAVDPKTGKRVRSRLTLRERHSQASCGERVQEISLAEPACGSIRVTAPPQAEKRTAQVGKEKTHLSRFNPSPTMRLVTLEGGCLWG
jgi:hypothetical protein